MTDKNSTVYDINFFRPVSGLARESNRTITAFIIIWFVAVFGFQLLLITTNKMTPEETLLTFNETWPAMQAGEASTTERRDFSKSLLMVLGKNIAVSDVDKVVMKEAFSLSVAKLTPGTPPNPATVAAALEMESEEFGVVMAELLPHALVAVEGAAMSPDLPAIMEKYCTHPRGPLTDFTFIGFPFHYWYTAQLLLIIFVLLCLAYAFRIEKLYRKHDFVEEHN